MEFGLQEIISLVIALGLMGFLIFVIYAIMSKEEDVGEIATKKIGNQSLFLLEILLVVANGAEMLTAASIAATNTTFEVSYGGRLVLHAVLALTSILGGFAFSKQLKEAFEYWWKPVQWIQVAFSLLLVIVGPLGNLIIMAYSMNQFDALLGYQLLASNQVYTDGTPVLERVFVGKWQNVIDKQLDPVLFGTYVVTLIHFILVSVISVIAYDKVYNVGKSKTDKADKTDKKENKDADEKKDKKQKPDKVNFKPEAIDLMAQSLGNTISPPDILALYSNFTGDKKNMEGQIRNRASEYKFALSQLVEKTKALDKLSEGGNQGTMDYTRSKIKSLEEECKVIESKFATVLKELKNNK